MRLAIVPNLPGLSRSFPEIDIIRSALDICGNPAEEGDGVLRSDELLKLRTWGQSVAGLGDQLFFVESQLDAQKNQARQRIMQVTREAGGHGWSAPVAFTHGTRDESPQISPDGKRLAFASRRSGSRQVWVMDLSGGEARQVTFFKGGIAEFAWDPAHARMAVVARLFHGLAEYESPTGSHPPGADTAAYRYTRDVKIISQQYYKYDGTGFLDAAINRVVMLDLASGRFQVLAPGLHSVSHVVFSPDGNRLYYLQCPQESCDTQPSVRDIFCCEIATGAVTRLTRQGWNMSRLVMDPGGDFLIGTASDPEDHGYGNEELFHYDMGTHAIRSLSATLDRPVGDHMLTDTGGGSLDDPLIFPERGSVVMNVSQEGSVQLWEFGLDGQAPRPLSTGDHAVYSFSRMGNAILALWADDLCPSVLGIAGTEGGGLEEIARVPLPWNPGQLGVPQPLDITSPDGTRVEAWILLPGSLTSPVPAVVEIHGGPMSLYGHRFSFEMQWLRSLGYAVIYGNPRGSLGYGKEFCQTIMGQWGDKDYADVLAIVDGALQGPYGGHLDSGKMAIMGGSYGGFMVNWAISHTPRFRCAVTMRAVVNRLSAMGTSDLGWLRVPQYGTKPWWEDTAPYWQQSPLRYASEIVTPLLIEHQMNDFRLPVEQAEQLYHALKYLGREVKMMLYPDESHGMSRGGQPWHRVMRFQAIESWLHQYLEDGGKP